VGLVGLELANIRTRRMDLRGWSCRARRSVRSDPRLRRIGTQRDEWLLTLPRSEGIVSCARQPAGRGPSSPQPVGHPTMTPRLILAHSRWQIPHVLSQFGDSLSRQRVDMLILDNGTHLYKSHAAHLATRIIIVREAIGFVDCETSRSKVLRRRNLAGRPGDNRHKPVQTLRVGGEGLFGRHADCSGGGRGRLRRFGSLEALARTRAR
jgi:hypothetical protein